jgi:hypothetical protein
VGAFWTDQSAPFQRSTRTPLSEEPAAVHVVGELHDTPFKCVETAPAGVGTVCNDQVLPFQRSATDSE